MRICSYVVYTGTAGLSIGRQTFFASHVSACHCEPVLGPPQRGTLCGERSPKEALLPRWPSAGGEHGGLWGDEVRQSASPQGNLASWQYLGQIRSSCVFAGNSCVLLCAAARRTDCHVASLLAMTEGGTSLHPRIRTRLLHVIANQCAHWCGNPRPRRETWQIGATSGKSAAPLVFARSTTFCCALPQGVRIVPSLRSSQ